MPMFDGFDGFDGFALALLLPCALLGSAVPLTLLEDVPQPISLSLFASALVVAVAPTIPHLVRQGRRRLGRLGLPYALFFIAASTAFTFDEGLTFVVAVAVTPVYILFVDVLYVLGKVDGSQEFDSVRFVWYSATLYGTVRVATAVLVKATDLPAVAKEIVPLVVSTTETALMVAVDAGSYTFKYPSRAFMQYAIVKACLFCIVPRVERELIRIAT